MSVTSPVAFRPQIPMILQSDGLDDAANQHRNRAWPRNCHVRSIQPFELTYKRISPSAIVLTVPDAILALGVLVASEMPWPAPSIFKLPLMQQRTISENAIVSIDNSGYASIIEE